MIGTLTIPQIEELLSSNILGRIGCNDGTKTYVVPVNYVYDQGFVIAHSAVGMKIEMMRKNPFVCFEVDEMKTLTNWKSVIAWGQYEELINERDRYYAMKIFVDKMMHMKISETAKPPELFEGRVHPRSQGTSKPVIYRIILTEKTGRYEND
jgi:uncharacterized protein